LWGLGSLPGEGLFEQAADLLATPFTWLESLPASWFWFLPLRQGTVGATLLAGGGWATLALGGRRGLWKALLAFAGVVGGLSLIWKVGGPESGPEIVFFDVGQGDATLVRDGARAVLVDGGGWSHGDFGGRVLLPALNAHGIRGLTALVMTHPDRDHCRGLVDLASYLPVAEIWMGEGWEEECARQLAATPGTRLRILGGGDRGDLGSWEWKVLHPSRGERGGSEGQGTTNDRSLVLRWRVGSLCALLTGDLEEAGERRLGKVAGPELPCRVLKVAHHGSRTSTTTAFLASVSASLAVISVGRSNPYGHPSAAALERLRRSRVPVLRTDRDGEIRLRPGPGGTMRIDLPAGSR
jgi:competence protein ComEC